MELMKNQNLEDLLDTTTRGVDRQENDSSYFMVGRKANNEGWKGTWTYFGNNKDIGFFIKGFWDKDQKANAKDVEKQSEKEVITSELY